MHFFDKLFGSQPVPLNADAASDPFAGQGFIYTETDVSPDGTLRVLKGYSEGGKSPTLCEPRVVSAVTGEILIDLWHTYQNYMLRFSEPGFADLIVQNTHNNRTRELRISFASRTFAFSDGPTVPHSLANLPELASLL